MSTVDHFWHVAVSYAHSGGRIWDPGQRFICSAAEGLQLEANGHAIRDTAADGLRVTSASWYEARAEIDTAGGTVCKGQRFTCPDSEGARLESADQAVRLPWLPPETSTCTLLGQPTAQQARQAAGAASRVHRAHGAAMLSYSSATDAGAVVVRDGRSAAGTHHGRR